MTLEQIKNYTIGVIREIFPNRTDLNKIGSSNGELTFNGNAVRSIGNVVNMIGQYDIYDTTERIIGYYEGKPLYRKVFNLDSPVGIDGSWRATGAFVPNGEILIRCTARYEDLPYRMCGNSLIGEFESTGTGEIYMTNTVGTTFNITTIIAEYTKTTDQASSVTYGHPNDYSTEERIVGTWIDGRPIYQKTITGLSLNFVWNQQYVSLCNTTLAALGLSGIDRFVGNNASVYNTYNGQKACNPLNCTTNGTDVTLITNNSITGADTLTVQYIKTVSS